MSAADMFDQALDAPVIDLTAWDAQVRIEARNEGGAVDDKTPGQVAYEKYHSPAWWPSASAGIRAQWEAVAQAVLDHARTLGDDEVAVPVELLERWAEAIEMNGNAFVSELSDLAPDMRAHLPQDPPLDTDGAVIESMAEALADFDPTHEVCDDCRDRARAALAAYREAQQ